MLSKKMGSGQQSTLYSPKNGGFNTKPGPRKRWFLILLTIANGVYKPISGGLHPHSGICLRGCYDQGGPEKTSLDIF